jgi:exodeoxyribonuclease III
MIPLIDPKQDFKMNRRILSYNVNGIRAALGKGLAAWIKEVSPDIICLQEIKAGPGQFEIPLFEMLGYNCYIHSAEKKGYSGVAILSKDEPDRVIAGISIEKFDSEGRVLRADFNDFTLICAYIPSGTTGDIRQEFKMEFLSDFRRFVSEIRKDRKKLLICGDYNICHKPIDINHPELHKKSSGFLPEERAWFDEFLNDGFIDTYRMFNNEADQYSWWSYRAGSRAKNLGWRIDYHLVSEEMKGNILDAEILQKVQHSDHCPVGITLKLNDLS